MIALTYTFSNEMNRCSMQSSSVCVRVSPLKRLQAETWKIFRLCRSFNHFSERNSFRHYHIIALPSTTKIHVAEERQQTSGYVLCLWNSHRHLLLQRISTSTRLNVSKNSIFKGIPCFRIGLCLFGNKTSEKETLDFKIDSAVYMFDVLGICKCSISSIGI